MKVRIWRNYMPPVQEVGIITAVESEKPVTGILLQRMTGEEWRSPLEFSHPDGSVNVYRPSKNPSPFWNGGEQIHCTVFFGDVVAHKEVVVIGEVH